MTSPSLRISWLLAVLSGLTMYLAFPPVGFGPYAVASTGLLTAALWRGSVRRGLGLGFVAGLAFFVPLLTWMSVIGVDAWLLLSVFCAGWFALMGIGIAVVTRLPLSAFWVACLWVLQEALRGRIPWGGFPWGSVSFSQPGAGMAQWAPVGGAPFVTFVVALVGASAVAVISQLRSGNRRAAVPWVLVIAVVMLVPGLLPVLPASSGTARVAIVQGGTPQLGMGAMDVRRAVLDNHVQQTLRLAAAIDSGEAPRPDFVLWPENSSDIDPLIDDAAATEISRAATAVKAPIVAGAVLRSPEGDGLWNAGIVWTPDEGPTDLYVKTHPVPFGEFIPFRQQIAGLIGRFDRVPLDFLPGDRPGNLTVAGVDIGDVICFEVAYTDVVNAVVDGGASVITVQTNNATYGDTAQPDQQFRIEQLRALEYGRAVVVAATTGVSGVIHPDLNVSGEMGQGAVGWKVVDVPTYEGTTLAALVGHAVELVLACAGAVAILTAIVVRRRRSPRVDA